MIRGGSARTVMMDSMGSLILLVEHRMLTEETMAVTPALIAKLRKDFLVLMGNVPRVDTAEKLTTFRSGVTTFRALIERILNTAQEYLPDVARFAEQKFDNGLASDARYLSKNNEDPWRLSSALILPGRELEYYKQNSGIYSGRVKEAYLYQFTSEAQKWDRQVRRLAPKAWKWFESAATVIAKGVAHGGRGELAVDRGTGTLREMAGFKVRLDGFVGSDFEVEGMQKFERGLQLFRQLASARFPALLRNTPPFVLVFSGDPAGGNNAASWSAQAITVSFWGMHQDAKGVAHAVAHELGHGIYRNYLSGEAQNAWFSFIRGDTEPIDLRQVLKDLGDDGWIHEPNVYKSDPIRWLQVRGLGQDRSYRFERGEDIRRWIEGGGDPVVQVTRRQVTAYANKNPEEAFCEALGMLVAYGPKTVLPEVRQMLGLLLPQLKTESVEKESVMGTMRSLIEQLNEEMEAPCSPRTV